MKLKVGDKAPDFTLFNQDAANICLGDYKKKTGLITCLLAISDHNYML